MIIFFKKTASWLLRFMHLQLFISLIALPILISWGLPFSFLSPVGNLIFSPLLSFFLMLSSLLFFTQVLHIPNQWVAWCLEKITDLWLYCMSFADMYWLIGLKKPSLLGICCIPLVAVCILHLKIVRSTVHNCICLFVLLIASMVYIKMLTGTTTLVEKIPCNRGELTMLYDHQSLTIIDPGVMGQRINASSWVEYTLIPHVIKTIGACSIDHLIVLQPGAQTFEAITTLVQKMSLKNLYLVQWQGSFEKHVWAKFFKMRAVLGENKVKVHRISHKNSIIHVPTGYITLSPCGIITEKKISYPIISLIGSIQGHNLQVHSYKSNL